jgi:hypothetical protein
MLPGSTWQLGHGFWRASSIVFCPATISTTKTWPQPRHLNFHNWVSIVTVLLGLKERFANVSSPTVVAFAIPTPESRTWP